MLPKDLAIYHCERGRARPDCLRREAHGHYPALAWQLLEVYRRGIGRTRDEIHRDVDAVFADEPDCPPQRIRAFAKLLDRAGEYQTDVDQRAFRLRQRVFELAAIRHPLVAEPDALFQHCEREAKTAIAAEIGRPWEDIAAHLYADLPAYHRLRRFGDIDKPEELLRRYNVAQAQTLLFFAEEMTIIAAADFRRILRHVKFNRLLHEIQPIDDRQYRIRLTGPASVLHRTQRYGVALAKFLPGLLACRDWRMSARLRLPFGVAAYDLSPVDGLRSHLPAVDDFDSELERNFAEQFGESRDGWRLTRESRILVRDQKAFVPDFSFRHDDGTEVLLELVGFWTPEYLAAKCRTLSLFTDPPLLIATSKEGAKSLPTLPLEPIVFGSRLKVRDVLERLEEIRGERNRDNGAM